MVIAWHAGNRMPLFAWTVGRGIGLLLLEVAKRAAYQDVPSAQHPSMSVLTAQLDMV